MNGRPTALIAVRTVGAIRCRSGTGTSLRLAQYVSPSTAFDAQWSTDDGGGNTLGLTASHRHTTPTRIRDHHPIQAEVQIAATTAARPGMRVYTLHGLACRCHAAPSSPKVLAIRCSIDVIARSAPEVPRRPGLRGTNVAVPGVAAHHPG